MKSLFSTPLFVYQIINPITLVHSQEASYGKYTFDHYQNLPVYFTLEGNIKAYWSHANSWSGARGGTKIESIEVSLKTNKNKTINFNKNTLSFHLYEANGLSSFWTRNSSSKTWSIYITTEVFEDPLKTFDYNEKIKAIDIYIWKVKRQVKLKVIVDMLKWKNTLL